MLIIWDIFFWNGSLNSTTGGYILWLKSLKEFSTARLNDLSTTSPAIGIFYVLFICFGADLFLGRPGAITLAHTWNLIGLIILIIWDVPKAAKWFAFNTTYSSVAMSSVLYGWANDILRQDPDVRSFMLIAMNSISQSTTAWTPLLVYKTVEAPQFRKGYSFTAACSVCLIAMTWVIKYLHDRQEYVRIVSRCNKSQLTNYTGGRSKLSSTTTQWQAWRFRRSLYKQMTNILTRMAQWRYRSRVALRLIHIHVVAFSCSE